MVPGPGTAKGQTWEQVIRNPRSGATPGATLPPRAAPPLASPITGLADLTAHWSCGRFPQAQRPSVQLWPRPSPRVSEVSAKGSACPEPPHVTSRSGHHLPEPGLWYTTLPPPSILHPKAEATFLHENCHKPSEEPLVASPLLFGLKSKTYCDLTLEPRCPIALQALPHPSSPCSLEFHEPPTPGLLHILLPSEIPLELTHKQSITLLPLQPSAQCSHTPYSTPGSVVHVHV